MTRTLSMSLGTLLVAGVAACATQESRPPADGDDKTSSGLCNASTLGWTVGRSANEELVGRAQAESGAKLVRILHPGQVVTMEYSDSRLNLYLDAADKVERYSCG